MKDKVGIFSFFAGAGFLDLGFESISSFETVFVNEYHPPFREIYRESREKLGIKKPQFGHHLMKIEEFSKPENLETLMSFLKEANQTYKLTGFVGGPPCPDFSIGGKNKGKEGDDKKKSYKRLHRWRYSPTAAYGNNEVHLHPYKARRITIAEALAIQSLPKEFQVPLTITLTNAFKAIGNGVPFMDAKGLALTILNFVSTLIPAFKPLLNGEIDRSKPSRLYQPIAKAEQLSVLVASDDDRKKVIQEANKPQFLDLDVRFFPYSAVEELYVLCQNRKLKGVTEEFLDCYMESILIP